jgi:diguanylate cyclase (GGDEF)-like protein/PAS domain S-box-containing protein
MIKLIKNFSIQKKLISILLFSSISGLVIASLLLLVFEVSEFKQNVQSELSTVAELIGNRSTAAVLFNDPTVAKENLSSLVHLTMIQSACFYDESGKVFSSYQVPRYKMEPCLDGYTDELTHFNKTYLHIYRAVYLEGDLLGTIYIRANLEKKFLNKFQSLILLFVVLWLGTAVTFLLTTPLLRIITSPLNQLLNTVNKITDEKDYSQRAIKRNNDEVGKLVDAFNNMVTTVERQNNTLTLTKNHYFALYHDNPTMVFHLDAERIILSANKFGAKQLDSTNEALQNHSIFNFVHPNDIDAAKTLFNLCINSPQKIHKQELRKICHNGRVIWVRETVRLINDENQKNNFLLVCEDITETRLLSEKIEYQARYDSLTGLVNRREFEDRLQRAVKVAHDEKIEYALCYMDLDQFKIVNDTSGHLAGDELLRQLGAVLKEHIRKGDVLARLGGDEFGMLIKECSLKEAEHVCEKLKDVISSFQFVWEDRCFSIGVSIGISSINNCTGNSTDSLKEADAACYAAKEKGRNRVHTFRIDDEELALRQGEMQWVEKIKQGLGENRFILYGQLIVPCSKNQEGLHFETLIRYLDHQGNIIPPGAFLSSAERYGLVTTLDKWVISHLFDWMEKNQNCLSSLAMCSINLSGHSLADDSMLDFITDAFKQYSIPTTKICFEITETAAISNLNNATKFIRHLRKIGCSFSLDDFGSGLSSFAYLKNLPVDYVKIDGLFIKDILEDRVNLAMVKSINEVGHIMGKKTIAEFVENKKTFDLLRELGVCYAQGYDIAKPVPLSKLLKTHGQRIEKVENYVS